LHSSEQRHTAGPQETDLYGEEKAEAGPENQRKRRFCPPFTPVCAPSMFRSGLAGYRRSLEDGFHICTHRPSRHHDLVK